jgi:hypothetical protein
MNGKKLLLVVILVCALSAAALAQGLVGAPVDPRYGPNDPPPPPPPTSSSAKTSSGQPQSTAAKVADAVVALLMASRI